VGVIVSLRKSRLFGAVKSNHWCAWSADHIAQHPS
jgi:hypothetical protein